MSRKFGLFLIFIALLPILLLFFFPNSYMENDEFTISEKNKQQLLSYSYSVFDSHFSNESSNTLNNIKQMNLPQNYDIIFITVLNNGSVRGCQSGSTPKDHPNRLLSDVKEATIECIKDDRFGGMIKKEEQAHISIMFTFLYNTTWMYNTTPIFLQNNIELGVHSLGIIHNNTPTVFKESVPISNNYDLEYTLKRLCNKADLSTKCFDKEDVNLFRYDTQTFYGNRENEITDLYRYNILIDTDEITQKRIKQSITAGFKWFLHSVNNETGLLRYLYYPSENQYSSDNNHIRQMATLWSITEIQLFLNSSKANNLISNTLDYYMQFQHQTDNYSCLLIDEEAKLGINAFLILTLLNTPEYQNQSELLKEYAQGILHLQNPNGSFNTYFFSDKNSGQDYYPGEALLALMKLYNHTKNESYLESVEKAFPYYQNYWRKEKNTAFIPWHTQAYALLFQHTRDENLSDFIFEINDWLIDNYQIKTSHYPDEIGGFPKYFPKFSTSVFLEGINDAYLIAKQMNDSFHVQKYQDAIRNGTRFMLQTQFTEKNSFYLKYPHRAIGAYRTSLTENSIRIDNVQHALLALKKTYQNRIVNK